MASPIIFPGPVTRFSTPLGSPTSSKSSVSLMAVNGVIVAGFKTTVLPQTRAGAIFQAQVAMGKFQGVIIPITPRGFLIV